MLTNITVGRMQFAMDAWANWFGNVVYAHKGTHIPNTRLFQPGKYSPVDAFPQDSFWGKYADIPKEELTWWEKVDKAMVLRFRKAMRYERMGLLLDDILDEEEPEIAEAVARLPEHLRNARKARQSRAFECSFHNTWLPRNEWTDWKDDVSYLTPYIEWVNREMHERHAILRQDSN